MKRTSNSRSQAPRSSSSFAAGGAKKVQKAPSASSDGWQTTTPVKGRSAAAPAPMAPKKAIASASRFSAFETDSDSDEEAVADSRTAVAAEHPIIPAETPAEFFARLAREDPVLAAVARGLSWFEAEHGEDDPVIKASQARIAAQRAEREAQEARLAAMPVPSAPPATQEELDAHYLFLCRSSEDEFWAQSFTDNLEERIPDYFDTTGLTDDEFHAMLAWAYDKGWNVDVCGRETVRLQSDDGPSRRYIPDNFWERPAVTCCDHEHKHGPKKAKTSTIPRFCRTANCEDLDCRYVHEDTIPKTNRPCGFGATCGAADPTGVKRSQCLFMHPGETWTPASCIHRPAPKAE